MMFSFSLFAPTFFSGFCFVEIAMGGRFGAAFCNGTVAFNSFVMCLC